MVRYLEDREKLNIASLYEECFEEEQEYLNHFYDNILPYNAIAVYEENKHILSMLQLVSRKVVLGGNVISCNYIYGVATKKTERKKGFSKEVFAKVLRDLYNNQECFTYLIPSSAENAEIYKKYGFDYVMDKKQLKPKKEWRKATHSLILRKVDSLDVKRLSIFARSHMEKNYGIYLYKDKDYFNRINSLMMAEGGTIDLYFDNKIVLGYRIGFEDEIIEEVLDDEILSMSRLSSESQKYAMARLLNVSHTLEMLKTTSAGEVVIKLSDDVIEDNNGVFLMKYDRNGVQWKKTRLKPDLSVSIGELTAHVFGYEKIMRLPDFDVKAGFFINDYV